MTSEHDWQIWPETDGQEQRCMKCGQYRKTPKALETQEDARARKKAMVKARHEKVARIIDPDAWILYDKANELTKMHERVSVWRVLPSLDKADAIIAALRQC